MIVHSDGSKTLCLLQPEDPNARRIATLFVEHELGGTLASEYAQDALIRCINVDLQHHVDRCWWSTLDVNEMLEHVRVLHGLTLTAKETPNGTVRQQP